MNQQNLLVSIVSIFHKNCKRAGKLAINHFDKLSACAALCVKDSMN
jgi:hypothetical protein